MAAPELEEDTPHVLLVEDDEGLADLYSIWLEGFCTVTAVNDCASAYEKFGESFDVVLLDRHLPDGKGDELLREIRSLSCDWPVAMVTAEEPDMNILSMEFDEYLCKPVSKEELQNVVTRLVAQTNYEEVITRFNRLTTKKKLMEEHYSHASLAERNEYSILLKQLDECRDKLRNKTEYFPGVELHIEDSSSPVSCD